MSSDAPAAHAPAAPGDTLPPAERILLIDVVRGMALFGILIMNIPAFTDAGSELTSGPAAQLATVLRDMLFAGKFNSIFSMLFGLGFTLQLARLEARWPERATAIYLRRLAWLFGLGLVHAVFFFSSDVLHMYALLGFGLLWLRRWPDRALVALMIFCLMGPAISQLLRALLAAPAATAGAAAATAAALDHWSPAEVQAFGHGSWPDAVQMAMRVFVGMYSDPQQLRLHLSFYAQVLTTMVLGLLIGRHRLLAQLPLLMPRVVRWQHGTFWIGLACTGVFALGHGSNEHYTGSPVFRALVGSCFVLARVALMAFYVLSVVRLMQHPAWQRRFAPLAAAGRMPLSNYLLQTALCSLLFYGYGASLWNQVGPVGELLIAPALYFGIQLPLSIWWLRRFGQGPFERLWRRATYGREGLSGAPAR